MCADAFALAIEKEYLRDKALLEVAFKWTLLPWGESSLVEAPAVGRKLAGGGMRKWGSAPDLLLISATCAGEAGGGARAA